MEQQRLTKKRLRPDTEEDANAKYQRAAQPSSCSFMVTSPAFRMGGGGIRFKYSNVLFDLLPHTPTPHSMEEANTKRSENDNDNRYLYPMLRNKSPHVLYWLLAYKTDVFTSYNISLVNRLDSGATVLEYHVGAALHPSMRRFTNRNPDPQKFPEICAFIAKMQQCVQENPVNWKETWKQQHKPHQVLFIKHLFENTNPKVLERLYLCVPDEFTPQGTYWLNLCENPAASQWLLAFRCFFEKIVVGNKTGELIVDEQDRRTFMENNRKRMCSQRLLMRNHAPELTELVCNVAQGWLEKIDTKPLYVRKQFHHAMLENLLQNCNPTVCEWVFAQPVLKSEFSYWFRALSHHPRNATLAELHHYICNPHVWTHVYSLWNLGGFERRVKTERAEWSNSPVWDGWRPPFITTFTADTAVTLDLMRMATGVNEAVRNEWEQRVCNILDDWNDILFLVPHNQSPQAAAFLSAYWDICRHVRDDCSNKFRPDRTIFESVLLEQNGLFDLDYAAMRRDAVPFNQELTQAALHPKRVQKWIEADFDFSTHEEHNYMSCSFP